MFSGNLFHNIEFVSFWYQYLFLAYWSLRMNLTVQLLKLWIMLSAFPSFTLFEDDEIWSSEVVAIKIIRSFEVDDRCYLISCSGCDCLIVEILSDFFPCLSIG